MSEPRRWSINIPWSDELAAFLPTITGPHTEATVDVIEAEPVLARIKQLEAQLKEANELIEFYGAGGNFNADVWQHENLGFFTGKRARAYLKKWKGKK